MKKVIFMGTPSFAVPILQALIDDENIEIVGVVTQPDRKVGRKQTLTPPPIKELAIKYNLPVYQPVKSGIGCVISSSGIVKIGICVTDPSTPSNRPALS